MKTGISYLLFVFVLIGCHSDTSFKTVSNRIQYDVINTVLNQYIFIPYGNDVRPVGYTGCIYRLLPGNNLKDQMKEYVIMVNDLISEKDKEYLIWQIDETWNKKINRSLIDSYNITIIKDQNKNLEDPCSSILVFLSPPVFSQDKLYAFMWQSVKYKDLQAAFIITLHQEKKRWQMVSHVVVNEE